MMKILRSTNIFFIYCLFISAVVFLLGHDSLAYDLSSYSKNTSYSKESKKAGYNNYVESGNYYLQHDLYEDAKIQLWKAVDLDPVNPDAYVNLGIVHIQLKEYDNAIRLLKQAESLSESSYFQSEILIYN